MTRKRNHLTALSLVLSLTGGTTAFAQTEDPTPRAGSVAKMEIIALTFPGGTVQQYVDALRKVAPGCNVILADADVGALPAPRIQLTDVSVRSAVELLSGDVTLEDGTECYVDVSEIQPESVASRSVFRISLKCDPRQTRRAEVHVWSVSDLLGESITEEAILTAIESSIKLLGGDRPNAEILFHGDTGLVLASGDDDQLSAIDRVINGLQRSVNERRQVEQRKARTQRQSAPNTLGAVNEELQRLRQQVAQQEQVIKQLKSRSED